MSTDTEETYPATFGEVIETVGDIPRPDPNTHVVCDWGNPTTCQDDNNLRAEFAGLALRAYAERVSSLDEDPETTLGDLFNDLRHLCDALDLDYEYLAGRDIHYACELRGEF